MLHKLREIVKEKNEKNTTFSKIRLVIPMVKKIDCFPSNG